LAETAATAARATREGLRRLVCLAEHKELRAQLAWLPGLDQWKLYAATLCSSRQLEQQLAELIADRAFLDNAAIPRTAAEFEQFRRRGATRIGVAVQTITPLMRRLFESYHRAQLAIEEYDSPRWPDAIADVKSQLAALTGERFLLRTPYAWLEHYPRYFEAICVRLDRLASGGLDRDRQGMDELRPFLDAYRQRRRNGERSPIPTMRNWSTSAGCWRNSASRLFAQTLGTSLTVSAKRLEKQWAKVSGAKPSAPSSADADG
jgi:ATP-dependent helicase HrpA